jgi:hypothetical protein
MFGNVLLVLKYKYITLKKGSSSLTRNLTNLRSPFFCWKPRRSKMPRNVSPPGGNWLRDFSIKYTHSFLLSSNFWSCQHGKEGKNQKSRRLAMVDLQPSPKGVKDSNTSVVSWFKFEIQHQHKKVRKFIECDLNSQRSLRTHTFGKCFAAETMMTGLPFISGEVCRQASPLDATLEMDASVISSTPNSLRHSCTTHHHRLSLATELTYPSRNPTQKPIIQKLYRAAPSCVP